MTIQLTTNIADDATPTSELYESSEWILCRTRTGRKVHAAYAGSSVTRCGHWLRYDSARGRVRLSQVGDYMLCERCFQPLEEAPAEEPAPVAEPVVEEAPVDETLAKMVAEHALVTERGTIDPKTNELAVFTVVGSWRGYAVLRSAGGTEHKAPVGDLEVVDLLTERAKITPANLAAFTRQLAAELELGYSNGIDVPDGPRLSSGYIGNLTATRDDREWCIWIDGLRDRDGGSVKVSYRLGRTPELFLGRDWWQTGRELRSRFVIVFNRARVVDLELRVAELERRLAATEQLSEQLAEARS